MRLNIKVDFTEDAALGDANENSSNLHWCDYNGKLPYDAISMLVLSDAAADDDDDYDDDRVVIITDRLHNARLVRQIDYKV